MKWHLGGFIFLHAIAIALSASCNELDARMFECQDDASHCCINKGAGDQKGGFGLVGLPPHCISPSLKTLDGNYASFRKALPKINRAKLPDSPRIYREAWDATKSDIATSAFCILSKGGNCENDQEVEIRDIDFVSRCSTLYGGTLRLPDELLGQMWL